MSQPTTTVSKPIGLVPNFSINNNSTINSNFVPVPGTLSPLSQSDPDSPQIEGVPHKTQSPSTALSDLETLRLGGTSSGEHAPMDTAGDAPVTQQNSNSAPNPPSPPADPLERRTFTELQAQLNKDTAVLDDREAKFDKRKAKLDKRNTRLTAFQSAMTLRDTQQNTRETELNARTATLDKRDSDLGKQQADHKAAIDNLLKINADLQDALNQAEVNRIQGGEAKRETKESAPLPSAPAADPFNGAYPNMNMRPRLPAPPFTLANAVDSASADKANKLVWFLDTVTDVTTVIDAMDISEMPKLKDPNFLLPERPAPNSGSRFENQARTLFFEVKTGAGILKSVAEKMRSNVKLASMARLSGELSRKHAGSVHGAISNMKASRKSALQSARDARADLMAQARAPQ